MDVDSNLQEVKAGKVDKDGNFNNWASTAPSKPGKVFAPESVSEVQDILAEVSCGRRRGAVQLPCVHRCCTTTGLADNRLCYMYVPLCFSVLGWLGMLCYMVCHSV